MQLTIRPDPLQILGSLGRGFLVLRPFLVVMVGLAVDKFANELVALWAFLGRLDLD